MPKLTLISSAVVDAFYEQKHIEKKHIEQQQWFHDLHIADEIALERFAAWQSYMHEVADREAQQLAWQRMRDELNDKNLQRVFASHAVIGAVNNGFYVDSKPYDEAIAQLRALDADIALLNRQIDLLAGKISEAHDQYWQEAAEKISNEITVSADDIFAKYVAESDALLE